MFAERAWSLCCPAEQYPRYGNKDPPLRPAMKPRLTSLPASAPPPQTATMPSLFSVLIACVALASALAPCTGTSRPAPF